jgi:2-C-methyl-D-erythritol 4-phosphate cytidylyltransferase
MYNQHPVYAIVLAAGTGSRMHADTKKQFMEVHGLPLFLYSYKTFQSNSYIDGIIVVTGEEDIPAVNNMLLQAKAEKLCCVTAGGKERYHSVYQGLYAIERLLTVNLLSHKETSEDPIVLIHDGARPFITNEMIENSVHNVMLYNAVTVAMPVKDTIKRVDDHDIVSETLERSSLYMIQTPQSFFFKLIFKAYSKLIAKDRAGTLEKTITDDAQVLETFTDQKVRIIPGSYNNFKITTPEDLPLAEYFLSRHSV